MSATEEGPDGQKKRKKSTLLATAPIDATPHVAPPQKAAWHGKVIASAAVLGLLGIAYATTQGGETSEQSSIGSRTTATTTTTQTETPAVVAEVAEPVADPISATPTQPATPQVAESVTETVAPAETVETAEVVEPAAPEIQFIQPVSGATACESGIYDDLALLQRAASENATWMSHQGNVTKLVQDIINCEGTSFEVIGSFDALNANEADLSIKWDASEKNLTLEMIGVDTDAVPMVDPEPSDASFMLR